MKKLLANIGGKVAALADDIASYNDSTRYGSTSKPTGPGPGSVPGVKSASTGRDVDAGAVLDPVLEHLLRNVRSRHVRQHFARTPATEYTQLREVTIQVATFNVAGKKPPPGLKLDDWLGAGPATGGMRGRWPPGAATTTAVGANGGDGPDMLAVGFAEIVPLSAGNVMGVWGSLHVDAWDRCLAVYLNGEEWATQRYGPSAPAAAGQAAAGATAATLLDTKWHGGGGAADAAPGTLNGSSATAICTGGGANPRSYSKVSAAGVTGGSSVQVDQEYVQVASKQLVGVYLSVWVRRKLLPEIRGVQVTTVATGFGGYLGNKGAVAARMRLYDSSLVFVASHLTAGEAEGDELRRNADMHEILRRAIFTSAPDGGGAVAMTAASAALISASLGPGHWPSSTSGITDHDLVIWVGDLNYRISTVPSAGTTASLAAGTTGEVRPMGQLGLTDADVRAAIRTGRLDLLLAADQLNRERAAGRVFQGWHEGRLTFLPTYKFKMGTHVYNGDDLTPSGSAGSLTAAAAMPTAAAFAAPPSGEGDDGDSGAAAGPGGTAADPEKHKRRTPAWCDRILWWTRTGLRNQQTHQTHPSPPHAVAGHGASGTATGPTVAPGLRQLAYWRGELTVSDHKPVAAAFVAEVVSYDRRRIEGVLEAGMRAVDLMQESLRPRVTVEPVVLEAGEWVALGRPIPMRVHLTNTGTVEAIFHFVPPPHPGRRGLGDKFGLDDETPPLPPWLVAMPAEGVVAPGESCEITLTVLVEGGAGGAAAQLSDERPSSSSTASSPPLTHGSLDSIVILRVEDSGDKFISIGGRYRRSFLGMSLEALSRLGSRPPLGLLEAVELAEHLGLGRTKQELEGAPVAADDGSTDDGTVDPPKEVRALVSELLGNSAAALRVPGILVDSAALVLARAAAIQPTSLEAQRALLRQLEPLRLILDAGGRVPPGTDPHDVAAMLLLWCGQLPYPLIPAAAADAAAAAPPASPAEAAALLRRLCSPLQLAVVSELLRLLRAALEPAAADLNGLTAARLAAAAAAWWMPPLPAGAVAGASSAQRSLLTLLIAGGDASSSWPLE
ncbi:hypothetical protein Vretifemale_13525 [Volvox reticuliferus]|uniref:Inositol polyphosphate-related phosphatase domain-containing protein n=1 Tax=Volvox reticuliferus TaxID=1737510 RepID=A0A8J4FUL0_9CHLO|nr:hypothetical protein Vretifemale_13525 [Volvox reticuliferus]